MDPRNSARRRLLEFLLASPLLAGAGPLLARDRPDAILVRDALDAADVFDFEAVAKATLPPAHWGYLATGVDGDATLRANRRAIERRALRTRRMVDVSKVDTSIELFGERWDAPVFLCPVGSQRCFHPDGELASARAAASRKTLQVLSTVTTTPVEEANAARGQAVWFQLYPTDQWAITEALIRRAEAAGCPALAVTVDLQGGSNRVTLAKARRGDTRDCLACHGSDPMKSLTTLKRKPMFAGLDMDAFTSLQPMDMTWSFLDRIRDRWPRKLLVKGIVDGEDAKLAVKHGVDGIVVSNHGGRADDGGRGTLDGLVDVLAGVRGRVPVLVDSGFRRGSDIAKALALGATAVGVGRPYIWGLASFGQAGVEAVLDILRRELVNAMRHAGATRVAELRPDLVLPA